MGDTYTDFVPSITGLDEMQLSDETTVVLTERELVVNVVFVDDPLPGISDVSVTFFFEEGTVLDTGFLSVPMDRDGAPYWLSMPTGQDLADGRWFGDTKEKSRTHFPKGDGHSVTAVERGFRYVRDTTNWDFDEAGTGFAGATVHVSGPTPGYTPPRGSAPYLSSSCRYYAEPSNPDHEVEWAQVLARNNPSKPPPDPVPPTTEHPTTTLGPPPAADQVSPSVLSDILPTLRSDMQAHGVGGLRCESLVDAVFYDTPTTCLSERGYVEILIPSDGNPPSWWFDAGEFQSPSGNIRCAFDASTAQCAIGDYDFAFDDSQCGIYGPVMTLTSGMAELACGTDAIGPGDPWVMPYGTSWTIGDIVCESATSGVTCRDTSTGRGFTLARAAANTIQ